MESRRAKNYHSSHLLVDAVIARQDTLRACAENFATRTSRIARTRCRSKRKTPQPERTNRLGVTPRPTHVTIAAINKAAHVGRSAAAREGTAQRQRKRRRVSFGLTGPLASHGTTDCPSSADFVPRLARGSLPLFLFVAGRAGRSGDDHRRARRQGRDHRRDPPGTRPRPIDPGPVLRIHPACAARRSRPLDHFQPDGERGTGDDDRARRSN